MMLNRTKRRWKAAAELAVAPQALLLEADRLAGEIAQQVWLLHGGALWADAPTEGGVLTLQALILSLLTPEVVMSSAVLRYLSTLEHAVVSSDYEDVPAVGAELAWVRTFLKPRVSSEAVENIAAAVQHERLRAELLVTFKQVLSATFSAV